MTFSLNNQKLFLVRLFLLAVIASPITASIGCRDQLQPEYEKLGLVDISGRVTLDGQPLANCTVIFEESEFLYSSGVTDANGNYKLMFDSRKSGIAPGEKTVRFKAGTPAKENSSRAEEEDPDAKPTAAKGPAIPDCYGKESKLKVTVSGNDSSFNFDLKSDCSTTGKS